MRESIFVRILVRILNHFFSSPTETSGQQAFKSQILTIFNRECVDSIFLQLTSSQFALCATAGAPVDFIRPSIAGGCVRVTFIRSNATNTRPESRTTENELFFGGNVRSHICELRFKDSRDPNSISRV